MIDRNWPTAICRRKTAEKLADSNRTIYWPTENGQDKMGDEKAQRKQIGRRSGVLVGSVLKRCSLLKNGKKSVLGRVSVCLREQKRKGWAKTGPENRTTKDKKKRTKKKRQKKTG